VERDGVVPPTDGLVQSSILCALDDAAISAEVALKDAISRNGIVIRCKSKFYFDLLESRCPDSG